MRVLIIILFSFLSISAYSQSSIEKYFDATVRELKAQSQIDKKDLAVYQLLESFYNETLQSDKGELTEATADKIHRYAAGKNVKNNHLLSLFLMYQEHISQTAAQGKRANLDYQLACINLLEKEMLLLYQKVPTIVYIYKAEALESAGRKDEATALVEASLKKDPASIPLKVYKYLGTKDETIKTDLATNHPGHWMVQQFKIK